jgi:hypothetical protein
MKIESWGINPVLLERKEGQTGPNMVDKRRSTVYFHLYQEDGNFTRLDDAINIIKAAFEQKIQGCIQYDKCRLYHCLLDLDNEVKKQMNTLKDMIKGDEENGVTAN